MIEGAMPILERELKAKAERHRLSGKMIASIKTTTVERTKSGAHYAITRPTGVDNRQASTRKKKTPVRNMAKLMYIEHGVKTNGTTRQKPDPIVETVIKESAVAVEKKMWEIYEREVSK
jgi:hypothetical protein